jgi:hypothetical protein
MGVVSFTPWPLYPREKSRRNHCIGGWVGPRAGLDAVNKRNISIILLKVILIESKDV